MARQTRHETKRVRLGDFPDYVDAARQLADLHARRAARNEERSTLSIRMAAAGKQTQSQRLDARAAALLSPDVASGNAAVSLSEMHERAAALDDEIATLGAAIRIQTNEVERLHTVHGGEVRDAALPEHRRLVVEIAELVVRLAQVTHAERVLRAEVERDGAFLPPLTVPWVGSLTDPDSWVARYLRECRERGYDVPEATTAQREAPYAAA